MSRQVKEYRPYEECKEDPTLNKIISEIINDLLDGKIVRIWVNEELAFNCRYFKNMLIVAGCGIDELGDSPITGFEYDIVIKKPKHDHKVRHVYYYYIPKSKLHLAVKQLVGECI